MTDVHQIVLALVLLAAGTSGCLGGPDGRSDASASEEAHLEAEDASPASPSVEGEGELVPVQFDSEPVDQTLWANGSFAVNEACFPVGCTTDDAYHRTELGADIPEQTPTTVRAELTHAGGAPARFESIEMYVYGEEARFYTYENVDEAGGETVEAVVSPGSSPLVVEVFYAQRTDTEGDYTLRIDVASSPTVLPPGVPVAVDAEPDEPLVAEPAGEGSDGPVRLLAYGPDDAFLADLGDGGDRLETRLPETTTAGEHVFVVPADSPSLRVATKAPTEAEPLAFAYEQGEPHPVDAHPVAWSFEVGHHPLAVGVVQETDQPFAVSTDRGQATLTGPEGTALDAELGCGFCLTSEGYTVSAATPIGDAAVTSGSYEAVYEPAAEAGNAVSEFVVTYER